MRAISIQASAEAIDFSQSLASRLHRPSQGNVRSTTQRRGSTSKPCVLAVRLTICKVNVATLRNGPQLRTGITALSKDMPEPRLTSENGFECHNCPIAGLNVSVVNASFDELIISLFFAGIRFETLPVRIWNSLLNAEPTIAAVSALLIAITCLALILDWMIRHRHGQPAP